MVLHFATQSPADPSLTPGPPLAELFLTNADKGCNAKNDILIAELLKRTRAIQALGRTTDDEQLSRRARNLPRANHDHPHNKIAPERTNLASKVSKGTNRQVAGGSATDPPWHHDQDDPRDAHRPGAGQRLRQHAHGDELAHQMQLVSVTIR